MCTRHRACTSMCRSHASCVTLSLLRQAKTLCGRSWKLTPSGLSKSRGTTFHGMTSKTRRAKSGCSAALAPRRRVARNEPSHVFIATECRIVYASESSLKDESSAGIALWRWRSLARVGRTSRRARFARGGRTGGGGRGRLPRRVPGGRSHPVLKYLKESWSLISLSTCGLSKLSGGARCAVSALSLIHI